ncbi:MAG: SPX domain-containing protein [Podila humilis]|nr:MAG: SPX domain-containing protein [Podila humilis]
MKFAKYLQEEAVPEWRKAYINYKQGKKLLKAIESALDEIEAAEALKLGRIAVQDPEGSALERDPHYIHLHRQDSYDSPASTPIVDNTNTNRSDDSTPRTPIITRPRGNSRNNYSTIIIAPPTNLPRSLSNQALSPSLTICGDDQSTTSTAAASYGSSSPTSTFLEQQAQEPQGPQPFQRVQPQRSGSSFSHLSQSAMSQSSQLLKNLSRRFTIIYTPELSKTRARSIQVDENSFDTVLGQLIPEERIFFQFLHSQLAMVNKFYQDKELEAVTKLRVIKQQLYVANEWKRRYDEKTAKARAENGWYVADWSKVKSGLNNFMHSDANLTEDVTIGPYSGEAARNTLHTFSAASATRGGPLSNQDPEQGLYRRRGAHENRDPKYRLGAQDLAYQKQMILEDEEKRRQHLNHKVARTRIKAALYEFYRSLEMIKNYKVLNHTGRLKGRG